MKTPTTEHVKDNNGRTWHRVLASTGDYVFLWHYHPHGGTTYHTLEDLDQAFGPLSPTLGEDCDCCRTCAPDTPENRQKENNTTPEDPRRRIKSLEDLTPGRWYVMAGMKFRADDELNGLDADGYCLLTRLDLHAYLHQEAEIYELAEPTHLYMSTACMHDIHDKCRLTCKYCGVPCTCNCHAHKETP